MTKIQINKILSDLLGITLIIKRDDLYPSPGGGNKARKLDYIIPPAIVKGFNALVTAGSCQSNHVRATALYAAKLGWKSVMIIHDQKPEVFQGNLKLMSLAGAELRFIDKMAVKEEMDKAMKDLQGRGFNPFYIQGGGHCVEGSYAYYEAAKELRDQAGAILPDFIVVASGTGTTQAGLEIGVREFYPGCKVLGISISRNEERGKEAILEAMKELNDFLNQPVVLPDDIFFDDRWKGEGYERTYPELLETIRWAAHTEGLILDPTYTGKAFHALCHNVKTGLIPANSTVVFWHTGGLINLLATDKI